MHLETGPSGRMHQMSTCDEGPRDPKVVKLLNPLHELSRNGLNDLKKAAMRRQAKLPKLAGTEASRDFPLVARRHATLKAQPHVVSFPALRPCGSTPASHQEKRSPSVAKVVTTSRNFRHASPPPPTCSEERA